MTTGRWNVDTASVSVAAGGQRAPIPTVPAATAAPGRDRQTDEESLSAGAAQPRYSAMGPTASSILSTGVTVNVMYSE